MALRAHSPDGKADPNVVADVLRQVLGKQDRPLVELTPAVEAIPDDPTKLSDTDLHRLIRNLR